jgi:hypothetical protein
MVAVYILGALVLVLALLLLTPLRVRASYDRGAVAVGIRYGPVKIALYPRPEKKKPEKEKAEKAPPEKEKKPKAKPNRQQIRYSLNTLPPILGRALGRVRRRIRIEPMKLHLLVAGTDPADTAELYGKLEAALGAFLPALHRYVTIRDQDVRLFLDFQEENMDCIADIGVSLRPWDALVIALGAGGGLLKWLRGYQKLADQPAGESANHKSAA